jgi:hypothetical protein
MERLMPSLKEDQLTQKLRETNTRLRFWLDNLAPDQPCSNPSTLRLISGLLSELLHAGEWMRAELPAERDWQLQAELGEYRHNLERLRDQMPAIHSSLLAERARLEAERSRIESAMEWAQSSRQTL